MSTPFRRAERERRPVSAGVAFLAAGTWGSVLVTLGGYLTNDLPPGAIRDALSPLHWAYGHAAGRALGWCLVVVGLLVLARSWWRLVEAVRRGGSDEASRAGGVALARRAVIRWSLPLLVAPPLFSHDGWSYLAQGALTQSGRDPYVVTPGDMPELLTSMVDPIWRYTPTPYGPLPLTWGALCTEIIKEPTLLVWLQRVPCILGLVLTAWAVPRLAARLDVDPALASALTLASPFVLAHGIGGMHNDALVMGLASAALVIAARGGWKVGSAVVGVAAGVKFTAVIGAIPIALLSLPFFVPRRGRFVRLAAAGLIAAAVTVACGIPYGLGVGWIRALSVPGVVVTPASIPTAVGFALEHLVALVDENASGFVMPVTRAIGMALAVAVVLVAALVRPTGKLPSAMVTTALVFAAIVLLAPVVHSWYALTILPVGVLLAMRTGQVQLVVALGLASSLGVIWDSRLAGASLLVGAVIVATHELALRRPHQVPACVRAWVLG